MTALTIALPAYNEEDNLRAVVNEVLKVGPTIADELEVLIIEDGSDDSTPRIADELGAGDYRVRVIHHESNRGFSGAMMSALTCAAHDMVVIGPSDGQAEFRDVALLLQAAKDNDLVFSYRLGRRDSWRRKLASWMWYWYITVIMGCRFRQFSSLFLFRCSVVDRLRLNVDPGGANFLPFLYAIAQRSGVRAAWVGTIQLERLSGRSKGGNPGMILRTLLEGFRLAWRIRTRSRRMSNR